MNQDARSWQFFALRMGAPALAAITLFFCMIQFLVIPAFERAVLEERREMIKQLTETAWSVLQDLHEEERAGKISRQAAQEMAHNVINTMRYGEDGKDYFWVLDQHPRMIAHPYRRDLEGQDVSDFQDPTGKRLFLEFAQLVKAQESGYVAYRWQKRDDETQVVPKLSYVKGFAPWGWIVGTGVYIEDVDADIAKLTHHIVLISLAILGLIGGIIAYMVLQGIRIETARQQAESGLRESKEKYQALVEASGDGFILLLDQRDMVTNKTISTMLGYTEAEFRLLGVHDILAADEPEAANPGLHYLNALLQGKKVPAQFEARLLRKDGQTVDVILSASHLDVSGRAAVILIAREVSGHRQREQQRIDDEREAVIAEMQAALHFLNHSIEGVTHAIVPCAMHLSIHRAAQLMNQHGCSALLVVADDGQALGIVSDHDMRARAVARQLDPESAVVTIMTAPIVTISERALVFEAALVMHDAHILHLAVEDASGQICGMLSYTDLLKLQGYSAVSLIQSVQCAETPEDIALRRARLPILIKAVLDGGSKPENVTRIITSLADVVHRKLIKLAIEVLGEPPAPFAFVLLGSLGREEATLATRQRHAILFDSAIPAEQQGAVQAYFDALGRTVSDWLVTVGYPRDRGELTASESPAAQPIGVWKAQFSQWVRTAEPRDMRHIEHFVDLRWVYGDTTLVEQMRKHVEIAWQSQPLILYRLVEHALRYQPPLSLFGNIKPAASAATPGGFDIEAIMLSIVAIVRALALKHQVSETHTLSRLQRLRQLKHMSEEDDAEIQLAYLFLMQLLLKHQAVAAKGGQEIDHFIALDSLSHIEQITLKNVFHKISVLLAKLRIDFTGSPE